MVPPFDLLKAAVLEQYGGFGCGPRSRFGIHLDVDRDASGDITAAWTPGPHDEGPPGIVHGGVQAIVADAMAGWASAEAQANGGPDPLAFPVTTRLDLRFRRPLPIGRPLRLVAHSEPRRGQDLPSIVHLGTEEERRCTIASVVYRLLDKPWILNPYHEARDPV